MRTSKAMLFAISAVLVTGGTGLLGQDASGPDPKMSFFISSIGSGDGGNLGGLEGADRLCSQLASQAGAQPRKWRAFLSTTAGEGGPKVNARDRIGQGPWYNAKGAAVGPNVDALFLPGSPINKETALDERGNFVNGRGDTPNRHDILTGSTAEGLALDDTNCSNWTSSGPEKARVGHFDRTGGGEHPTSWVSSHDSRSCSQADLEATGGAGLIYCFATD